MDNTKGVKGEPGERGLPGTPYFEEKYSELKGQSGTYGELKSRIERYTSELIYTDVSWGMLLRTELMKLLEADWSSLKIQ